MSVKKAAQNLVDKLYKIEYESSEEAGEGYCFVCDSYVRHKSDCEVKLLKDALKVEDKKKGRVLK